MRRSSSYSWAAYRSRPARAVGPSGGRGLESLMAGAEWDILAYAQWTARATGAAPGQAAVKRRRGRERMLPASPYVWTAPRLLHRVHHVEDRQVHRDHHAADDHAQEHDHDRLHEREERAHGHVHLFVVEVRNLAQHLVEPAGLLADRDHRDDHRREDAGALERGRDGVAARDRLPALHHRVVNHAVAARLGGDLEALEDADAGADQGAQGPGEARDRRLPDEVAHDRGAEHEGVDLLPPRGRGV